jgi:hypothetical protein
VKCINLASFKILQKIGCYTGRPSCLLALPLALDTLSTTFAGHVDKTVFGNAPTHDRLPKVMWPADHTLARLSLCFVPRHFLVSFFVTMPYFGHNEDMHEF